MKKIVVFILGFILVSCHSQSYQLLNDGVLIHVKSSNNLKLVRLQVINDKVIHVTASNIDSFSSSKSLIISDSIKKSGNWKVNSNGDSIILFTAQLKVIVIKSTGKVDFFDINGKPILKEKAENSKTFIKITDAGKTKFIINQQFESPSNEAFYGLGQHQYNILNYKGKDIDLYQYNTKVSIPFVISSRNYGILWDNYSLSKFGDTRDYQPISTLKLFSVDGSEGSLIAKYSLRNNSGKTIISRKEKEINYETLDQKDSFPKELKMGDGIVFWEGSIMADTAGLYKFRFYSAGYGKVWINNKLVVDRWRQCWNATTSLFEVQLEKGTKCPIKVEWIPEADESYISLKYLRANEEMDKNTLSLYSTIANQIDYYFVYGNNADEIISGYRQLTGKATLLPKWAMGLWQSRERYKSQDEILNTGKEFRKRGIPLDNIVLDWQYWRDNQWGSQEFDTTRFPDAKGMLNDLHHKYNTQLMISVWPKFYEGIANFKTMDEKGFLYKLNIEKKRKDWIGYVSTFYDAFNPEARKVFWNMVNEHLFSKGIDGWWLDASEPDICSNLSTKERQDLMSPTALGSGAEYFNGFPLQNAKGVYEGQRKTNPDQRVFILTRSAFAGQQRYAAATWSGDIAARWDEMKRQIPAALNFSMSGLPYWTMDIGGFAVERKYETATGELLEEWRERMARWVEFGAFCPLFRMHGQLPYREFFTIAPENHPVYQAMLDADKLRYRLMPYIYSLAGHAYQNDYTIMRALPMDFASDLKTANIDDQYMFGPSIMVSPVCEFKARSRQVYLPENTNWYALNNGKYFKGGQTITADAPLSGIPLFIKAGSIIPIGPEVQYTSEKAADPISLYVYTGADGTFSIYEDENINYNYEKGQFSEIPLSYNEAEKTLTIGNRKGEFAGMLKQRTFNVIKVSKEQPVGINQNNKSDKVITYSGSELKIKI